MKRRRKIRKREQGPQTESIERKTGSKGELAKLEDRTIAYRKS